jgi:hypothetical protein
LLDPALYGDVMGYCSPDWISDFTYRALFERIALVNAEVEAKSLGLARVPSAYRSVIVGADASLRWGSRFTTSRVPHGAQRDLSLLGTNGSMLATITVTFRRLADDRGGFLLLPESALGASVRAIRLGNAVLALPNR